MANRMQCPSVSGLGSLGSHRQLLGVRTLRSQLDSYLESASVLACSSEMELAVWSWGSSSFSSFTCGEHIVASIEPDRAMLIITVQLTAVNLSKYDFFKYDFFTT